jgi:hypothetical protein
MEIAARAVQEGLEHGKYRLLNDMSQPDRPSMTSPSAPIHRIPSWYPVPIICGSGL